MASQREGEHEGQSGTLATCRKLAEAELEQRDADERERPPSPRREGEGDSEPSGEGDERPAERRQPAGAVDVVVVGRGGSTGASVVGSTRSRNTTIRSATDPGGWHANSVAECR